MPDDTGRRGPGFSVFWRGSSPNFARAKLQGRYITHHFEDCDFTKSNLSDSHLGGTFVRCTFSGANLKGANLHHCTFERCVFEDARLAHVSFNGSTLSDSP
ncbi:pentapeptide repeat-containing protein [Pyxidicoccus fallax]|uniref:Pentapeptide repeat-containing protein n=1 Tax=Pyxidicoccus fallax TaxID=394095 RepID=A0A848L8M1_9BACT|nr:pentapeptide repeat-containing protein [Pyxidicoccus fallax]NMO14916.1 pentapeptide repeat-containing protein [Pyxidicoccus fallax]NPC77492.1 pentapeptide repeat-containing protein [Pyxidicoccus fallax]